MHNIQICVQRKTASSLLR